jgi:phage major head subunit gpT-like protein
MLITPANLNILFTGVETRFWQAFTVEQLQYQKLCTTYPVGSENWISAWIPMTDKLREWNGARIVRTPAPQTYMVPIKPFEATYGIDKYKILDDSYGVYTPVVANLGKQAAKFPDYQLRDLLQNAGSWTGSFQNGTDGITHWNTAHPVDFYDASKGTYPNDYTNGGVTINSILVGGALSANAFATVYEDMTRRKSESGEPQEVVPDMALVPPMLKLPIDTILQAQFMGLPVIGTIGTGNFPTAGSPTPANGPLIGTTENVMKSWTDRMMWRDLGGSGTVGGGTYDQVWYLLDLSKPIRPFSWLQRMAPEFAFLINPTDPVVFNTRTFQYGVEARGSAAWALPFLSSRSGA